MRVFQSASFCFLSVVLVLGETGDAAGQEKVPKASSPGAVKPGQIALLEAPEGMSYFLQVPKSYHPKRGARVVVFLHGSNMNGLSYLKSFNARRWAVNDILVCPNGEKGDDPHGSNNFTFASASYVADLTRQVAGAFNTTRVYVGGHSQGGFLTYSVIMLYPDLYHGAFPMAGDCWMQNEPNLWEGKPEILKKQKKIAIAVIHGKNDRVVKFSQGQHAHDVFLAMAYPRIRLLAPEKLGHEFMRSPVPEALDWLDAVTGLDPGKGFQLAAGWMREGEYGWAMEVALAALEPENVSSRVKKFSQNIVKSVEKIAAREAKKTALVMEKKPPMEWLPVWYEFRRQFGRTQAAAELIKPYDTLRARQRQIGKNLFSQANAQFRSKNKEKGREFLREILENAPATFEAHYAVKWLAEE